MKNFSLFFFIPFFLLISSELIAQSVTISGKVQDIRSGEALIGTNILLYADTTGANKNLLKGTSTNEYGFYSLTNISKGKYFLIFKNLGYKELTEELNISISSGVMKIDVKMEESSIEMDEVIVQAARELADEVGKIDISPQLLSRLPTLSGEKDVFRTLQLLPGIKVASEISNGLYVRGGSPDQNLTIVDEVPLYNPAHLGNFASTFNSYAIQNIELYKGVYPSKYGGRIGSVLDIKLRSGTKEKEKGKIGLGLINTHYAFEGPMGENSTYILSGRFMYLDFLQQKFKTKSSTPRYNFSDVNLKTTYELEDGDIISISSNYSDDNLYSSGFNKEIDYNIGWNNFTLSLNWLQNGNSSLFSKTVISLVKYNFESILLDQLSTNLFSDYYASSDITDLNIMRNIEAKIFDDQKLFVGAGISLHNYDIIYSNIYSEKLDIGESISNIEGIAYAQHEFKLWNLVNINYGLRLNYFGDNDYVSFEPRFSVNYPFSEKIFLKAGITKNSQFVHLITRNNISLPTDIWYPSTKNIKPSQSYQYVFGIDSYFNDFEYRLSLEGYYRRIDNIYEFNDVVSYAVGDPIEELFISGEAEAYGIEIFFNKRIGNLTGWLGYTFSFTKKRFENLNRGKIFYPRYDRRHDISLVVSYDIFDQLSVGATWIYTSGQGITLPTGQYLFPNIGLNPNEELKFNYTARNAYKLPAYHKLDLNMNYHTTFLNSEVDLYLNLFNVYNRKNPFAYYITFKDRENQSEPVMKQITLFPFIPTFGIVFNF